MTNLTLAGLIRTSIAAVSAPTAFTLPFPNAGGGWCCRPRAVSWKEGWGGIVLL